MTNNPDTDYSQALAEGWRPIREVARITGVNAVTLRAWERRYSLIVPHRTAKGHRLYSPDQILRIKHILTWLNRGVSVSQVMPLLDYCLERGFELRFIELMRMGHLAKDSNAFLQQFVSLQQLLDLIGEHHEYLQADAPVDATAVRYQVPDKGFFGVIANESVPFCRTCSRLRLSSTGWLHGCLSSSNRHYVGDLLDKPRHQALPALQGLLMKALGDKQEVAFSVGATVMKIIGG